MAGTRLTRRLKALIALLVLVNVTVLVTVVRFVGRMHHVRVLAPQPAAEAMPAGDKARPVKGATRNGTSTAPGSSPPLMAATSPGDISAAMTGTGAESTVDGDEFVTMLTRVGGLSELETANIRKFLALISRSQGRVAGLTTGDRQADLERRLQQQAAIGVRIRVAAEKRAALEPILNKGVPTLAFRNAAPAP